MRSKHLGISGTCYTPMTVWNGENHRVRIRFRNARHISRDRGTVHTIVQRAAGFNGTRRLTLKRAARGKWHEVSIGRRKLAKRLMIEIEPLVVLGIVEIELDGCMVGTARKA